MQAHDGGDPRREGMDPKDQSLDRGYGGLPGEQPGEELDDDPMLDKPKRKIERVDQDPDTKH